MVCLLFFLSEYVTNAGAPDLLELKKNWEADKAKVEKLKASRRFKPY
jgi:hypothetical protein